jgi:hypothetical protein
LGIGEIEEECIPRLSGRGEANLKNLTNTLGSGWIVYRVYM